MKIQHGKSFIKWQNLKLKYIKQKLFFNNRIRIIPIIRISAMRKAKKKLNKDNPNKVKSNKLVNL